MTDHDPRIAEANAIATELERAVRVTG